MKHNTEFIQDFMRRYNYPDKAVRLFTKLLCDLDENESFGKTFDKYIEKYNSHKTNIAQLTTPLGALGLIHGYKFQTIHFVFLLCLTEKLKKSYALCGIPDEVYYDTMDDLRCKLLECMDCFGTPGTFVAPWFDGFFRLSRFAYGRFQYELATYNGPVVMLNSGKIVKPGDNYIGFHIPSSGISLTDDVRLDSYKKAYKAFSHLFDDGNVLFGCGSWLLYPGHRDFLPENMNILRFMDDFEIVDSNENHSFHDKWRVFGADAKKTAKHLPTDTRLKKAYAERLQKKEPTGSGFGFILFDGEKII